MTAITKAGTDLTAELSAENYIAFAGSYWTLGSAPPLRSTDNTQALLLAQIKGTDTEVDGEIDEIVEKYSGDRGELTVSITGQGPVFYEVGKTIEEDLRKAETIALGVTVILLVFVFGGFVAASLPLTIGIIAIVGSWLALRVIAELTEVSVYVISMTTIMGLGLAIDYALFVLSRFREELGDGVTSDDVAGALRRTMMTAGRTVIFSAITVAVSLSALLIFPLAFLRSFAYAGIAVVAVACAGAVIVLPAILAGLGRRVDALSFRRFLPRRKVAKSDEEGFWHRLAVAVMKRPVPFALGVTLLLLALGAPFLNLKLGVPDDRVLPPSAFTRGSERSDPQQLLVAGSIRGAGCDVGHRQRRRPH